jgi:hypothetical protein
VPQKETIHKDYEKIILNLQGSLCIRTGHKTTKTRSEVHKAADTMKKEVKE